VCSDLIPRGVDYTKFRDAIIKWYREFGEKDLPWRKAGDPWAVLVAALLLRKTTVKQVVDIYREFLRRYPSPARLADASVEEIKAIIQPLGMEHVRATLLKKLSEELVRRFNGQIPCDRDALKSLPGVGDYAASEVLLTACGKPEPLLDRNMIRVIERVFGIKSKKRRPHTDRELWNFARSLVPRDPELAKEFNFGVLDFARKVCTAKSPKCSLCPLANNVCVFYQKRERV